MKIIKNILALIVFTVSIGSCRQDNYLLFDTVSYVQFGPKASMVFNYLNYETYKFTDTLKSATFIYDLQTKTKDTIYFDVYPMGRPAQFDRPIVIQQIEVEGVENAVPGIHYIAFDSEEMKKEYIIKKDSVHLSLPIVILRDQSLKEKIVKLQFELKENDYFLLTDRRLSWRRLEFTDDLIKPDAWEDGIIISALGEYSKVKHQWMIELTGQRFDQEMILVLRNDYALKSYWSDFFKKELIKKNNELEAQLKDKFKDENGNYISFGK